MSRFKIENEKSARKMLADAVSSMGTVQRKLQALIIWGVAHAEKHGDHTFLTDLYRAAFAKNKRTAGQIQLYLFDLLNLEKQVVTEQGETVVKFVRVKDDDDKKLPLVKERELLSVNWWEHKKVSVAAEFDVAALEAYLAKKCKGNTTTAGAAAYMEALLAQIKADRVATLQVAA
jgi:hypothetical protein